MQIKATIFALSLALLATSTQAQESSQPLPESREQQQARADVMQASQAASIEKFDARVNVNFDSSGKVTSAKLEKSTGNLTLNRALIHWAQTQKIKPGASGSTTISYSKFSPPQ